MTSFMNSPFMNFPLPVLEEDGIEVKPWFPPLDVEVEGECDAEVSVIDLQNVRDVNLDGDGVGLVSQWDAHAVN